MSTKRLIALFVALVAFVALLLFWMHSRAKPAPAPVVVAAPAKAMVRVAVAKQDLSIGHRLSRDDLAWQDWPADAVNPAYITDGVAPAPVPVKASAADKAKGAVAAMPMMASISGSAAFTKLEGSIVREPMLAKEPIVETKIVRAGEGGVVGGVMPAGMRAMSVAISAENAAGGLIQPGDRVDIVQSRRVDKPSGGGSGPTSQDVESHVVLRNIRVIAIDQNIEAKSDKAMIGSTATLEVAANDAPVLARAKTQGDFVLALRSYADAGGPSGRVAPDTNNHQVKIYRAGQRSEVTVMQ